MEFKDLFEKYKDKVIRVWEKNGDPDETCGFEVLRNFYVLPNNDILLEFSDSGVYFSYQLLSELTIGFSNSDQEE